jgi:hypothetical protein
MPAKSSFSWSTLALLAAFCLAPPAARAVDGARLEAAIVYNILQFVEWPGESGQAAGEALTLCVDASSSVAHELHALAGRPVRRLKLALRDIADPREVHGCQALYVDSDLGRRAASHPEAGDRALLLIGSSEPPPLSNATVQLAQAGDRFVFDIDTRLARQAGLVVSSRLLRLARKVLE